MRTTKAELPNPSDDQVLRVLFVEDSQRDVKLCVRQLADSGFKLDVDVVADEMELLTALRSKTYDIVLSDYHLLNWSGLDALNILQQERADIPFILLTGTIGEEVAVQCIKYGATDYVLKDRPARLPQAIQRALREKVLREERMKAEQSRDLLAAIVQSSEDAIIGMNLDGTIATWNWGAERIFGYPAAAMLQQTISLVFAEDRTGELSTVLERLKREEPVERYESKAVRSDRRQIDVSVTMSVVRSSKGVIDGASAIIRDITREKQLERELVTAQKMEAIGRLAAGVAHDFNNLLTVVSGYSSLALGELKENDALRHLIEEISKASDRAAALTRQLLAFGRKQILQPKALIINEVVAGMDGMLRRLIGEDIDFVTVLDPALGWTKADPGQLEQVIMNLAVNARDAMPKGGNLTIETANLELTHPETHRYVTIAPGSYIMLSVTDSGTGMDPETQSHVFEPFFSTKGPGEGTGLGLSTVYGIVEHFGGRICVDSKLGHGTSFKIYLPRIQNLPTPVEEAPHERIPEGVETILLVEDEEGVRNLVCAILKKLGYTVLTAKNGAEALQVCRNMSNLIHLMITDIVMPQMSGVELARQVCTLRSDMKILFTSGYTDNTIAEHGFVGSEVALLQKPFAPKVLARTVRTILDKRG